MRYFEDFQPGEVIPLGSCVVRREEIIDFARKFDPQPFHVDDEAAHSAGFGGIIASGWHTAATCHRLLVEGLLNHTFSVGSPGLDELRWLRPVRPGDELSVRLEVLSMTPSRSKPERGAIKTRLEALNQEGEVVMTEVATVLFVRRAPESAECVETHFAREGLPAARIPGP